MSNFTFINRLCKDDLFDKLNKKSFFDENCSAFIMKQLLSALYYCHEHNIVHRDIKAENILIESTEIIQDRELFQHWCGGEDKWTHDTQLFTALSESRGLVTPIPGYATHCDTWVIAKIVDWQDVLDRTN